MQSCEKQVYFMLALVVVSVETGTPPIPFSPGWLLPLSMPTLVTPESEATGASPGAFFSPWTEFQKSVFCDMV